MAGQAGQSLPSYTTMTQEPSQEKPHVRKRDWFRKLAHPSRTPGEDNGSLTTPSANASASSVVISEDTLTAAETIPTRPLKVETTQDSNADHADLLRTPIPEPASTVEANDNSSASSTLWETAYNSLKMSDPKLIGEYENLLSEQLIIAKAEANKDTGQLPGDALANDPEGRREQMKRILEEGFNMASSSSRGLGEKTANVVQVVTTFKSLIDEAVKVSPEASLAWAGVSFFLPMLTNLYTENEAFKEAFSYVTSRAPVYAELEKELHGEVECISISLTLAFTELYTAVITFQAKAARRVFGKKSGKALRDAFKWDEWKGLSDAIKGAESELMEKINSDRSRISKIKLEEIVRNGEEYHRRLKGSLEDMLNELRKIVHLLENQEAISKKQLGYMDRDEARKVTKEVDECISHLFLTDPRLDKIRIEDTKGGLLNELDCWILENLDFQQWRSDERSRLLWINGNPGKGKTMLLCGIINDLEAKDSTKMELEAMDSTKLLAYFFCQATEPNINNATAVLRGLLYLLLDQQPSLVSHIRKKRDYAGKALFEGVNAWYALSSIFRDVLQDPSFTGAYLIVDALDECVIGLPKLLDFIVQTSGESYRVKWIVSSRSWPNIEKHLDEAEQKVTLSLESEAASVSTAVRSYIQHKVAYLARHNSYGKKEESAVLAHLSSNANDTFLWVALVCQNLANVNGLKVLAKLESFPPGLDALYDRMMQQISSSDNADLCKGILALVAIVYRPITFRELRCLCEDLEDVADDSIRHIIGLCGSFLTIRGVTIYFVHQSAKDFLFAKAFNVVFPSGTQDVHRCIFLKSLQALSKTLRRDMYNVSSPGYPIEKIIPPKPDSDPLAATRYSCVYWVDHLHDANVAKYSNYTIILKFFLFWLMILGLSGEMSQFTFLNRYLEFQDVLHDDGTVHTFLKKYYLYWLEALSLCKSMSKGVVSMAKLEVLVKGRTDAPALSELVGDARRFIMAHKSAIENSPLQSYASALVFSPTRSIIRDIFKEERQDCTIKPDMQEKWSACLQTLEGHSGWVSSIAFSHDSTRLVSGSYDSTVRIWDASSGECLQTLEGHSDSVISVAFSHDSTRLASGSDDSTVKIWDSSSGECLQMLEGNSNSFRSVAFSHDSTWLALGSDDSTVRIWDTSSGECFEMLEDNGSLVSSVVFSHDSTRLASGSYDHTVRIWDTSSGECLQTLKSHSSLVMSVAFSHDSNRLVSGSYDNTVKLWDMSSGECLQTLEGHGGSVSSLAFSHNSTRLVSGSVDRTVKIWDTSSGKCLQTLEGHSGPVTSVAFSHDSTRPASGSYDSTVKIWDMSSGEYLQTLEGHSSSVRSVAFSHDSTRLASGSDDYTVKIWSTSSGECLQTLEGNSSSVFSVAFSDESTWLASGSSDSTVSIWDTSSGECLQTLEGHNSWVRSVAFSHDSNRLASGSDDYTVRIWDTSSGECLQTLEGHSGSVSCLAFSQDSTRLVSGSVDRIVKIWDTSSGECLQTLEGPSSSVMTIALSHDPTRLAPRSEDETMIHQELGLSLDDIWITYNSENLLWLPSEYRPSCSVVYKDMIGLGTGRGRIWLYKVE